MTEWRTIPWFDDYEINVLGEVKRIGLSRCGCKPKILTHRIDKDGYPAVSVRKDGKNHTAAVHRLMAMAFHGLPPTPAHQVAHNDGSKTNFHPDNLRWATCKENQGDRVLHGTHIRGVRNVNAILTDDAVREIRNTKGSYGFRRGLAEKFGVSVMTISCVRSQSARWSHVAG